MCHRIGNHGRVHDPPISAGCLEQIERATCLDRGHQHRLNTIVANEPLPACQARRVNGRLDLQIRLASEELPIRVLDPCVDCNFIRAVIRMLQMQQPGHKPGRQRRSACRTRKVRGKRALDLLPVHRIAQQHQLVHGVEVLRQGKVKQISGLGRLQLRTH